MRRVTGANYGYEQTSFFDAAGDPPGTGQAIIAIDPGAFGSHALARFAEMADQIAGSDGARVPGHRRIAIRERLTRDGIPVDGALIDEISAIGAA